MTFSVFDKIQNAFMIKILKVGIEGKFLNPIKDVYNNKNKKTQLIPFLIIKDKMLFFFF